MKLVGTRVPVLAVPSRSSGGPTVRVFAPRGPRPKYDANRYGSNDLGDEHITRLPAEHVPHQQAQQLLTTQHPQTGPLTQQDELALQPRSCHFSNGPHTDTGAAREESDTIGSRKSFASLFDVGAGRYLPLCVSKGPSRLQPR